VAPRLRSLRRLRDLGRLPELSTKVSVEDDAGLASYRTYQWGWFPGFMPRAHGWLVTLLGLRTFDRYCSDRGRPDIIHAHCILHGGYLAARIRQRYHIPVVLTEHSSAFLSGLIRPGQARIVRYTLPRVDRGLAVGPDLAVALGSYAPEQDVEVLGNLVDAEFFVPGSAKLPETPFVFAAVALLTHTKGMDVLLDAFARAFWGQNVVLRIGGDGEERLALEQQVRSLDLEKQVEFAGLLSRAQVRTLMQQSHALVSTSYVETFGLSLIEAMACGKPVVATRSGGPEYIVNESNGLLVRPGDPDGLASAMQQLMQTWDQYDPVRIRADCVGRFGAQAVVGRLESIYRGLLRA
jgi:glycosyltransferase involved in cell wall biosynthesis